MKCLFLVVCFLLKLIWCEAQNQTIPNIVAQLKTNKAKADTLFYFSIEAAKKMKYDSAMHWLNEGTVYVKNANDKNLTAIYKLQKSGLYNMQGRHRQALEEIKDLDYYIGANQNYHISIRALLSKGQSYMLLGKQDSAIYYYFKAEEFNKTKKQATAISNWIVYTSLADLFNRAKDYDQAEKYYLQAFSLLKTNKKLHEYGYLLILINNFYLSWNRAEKAGFFLVEYANYQKYKKDIKGSDPLEKIIENVTNGQLENNISFMKKVKEASLKNGDILQVVMANGFIVRYYEKRGRYADALELVEENIALSQKANDIQSLYFSKQNKYQLLQKSGNYSEAVNIATEIFTLKDSIVTLEGRDRLYELEKKYQTQKKEKEIALLAYQNNLNDKEIALLISDKKIASIYLQQEMLKQDALRRENDLMDSLVQKEQTNNLLLTNENLMKTQELNKEAELKAALVRENTLKRKELTRQNQIKWGLLAGLSLLLLLGITTLMMYYKQKAKNAIIQKQATDLEILMKEIHHRVKNNLQIVSSLLDLQSHTITDVQAHEAVKEGKNRVQSMALIHQNLYREDNIKGIKLKEYVINLVQTLSDSYNISNDEVKINTTIDDLNIDIDTMIPLGLVLNELLSNAFKYAFSEKKNGEISILLKEEESKLHLMVSDNGRGFPIGLDIKSGKSFGLKMIRAFAQKLKAKLDIYNDGGAVIEMHITKYKIA